MKQTMKQWMLAAALVSTASFVVACGGGKEEEEEPAGPSMSDISGKLESPTGTVDETTAADVGRAFEASLGAPTGGERENGPVLAQSSTDVACSEGGNMSASASSDGTAVSLSYNECCQGGCCLDGELSTFTDTSGSSTYTTCLDYDLSGTCQGVAVDYAFSYCQGAAGIVYAISVNGDSFAVTGSMSNGTGTLTVVGENGSFSCTYTNYAGTCTDSVGGSFSF